MDGPFANEITDDLCTDINARQALAASLGSRGKTLLTPDAKRVSVPRRGSQNETAISSRDKDGSPI